MVKSYDATLPTDRDKVRLLAQENNTATAIFEDSEIEGFLAMEGGDVRLGAALTLETLAANQVLVLKKISLLELSTDGPALAAALREAAANLRNNVNEDSSDAGFDIAEPVYNKWQYRDKVNRTHGVSWW